MALTYLNFLAKRIFAYLERRLGLLVFLLFLWGLFFRWLVIYARDVIYGTGPIFFVDAYLYLLKALEILRGNWEPIRTHALGWPIFLAPFLSLQLSIFENMIRGSLVFIFLGSFIIVPLALIGREILNKKTLIISLFFYAFSGGWILVTLPGFSENLFTVLLLFSLYFTILSRRQLNYSLAAAALAAAAYWVRPNGLFLLPIILISLFIFKKDIAQFRYRYFIYIIVVFFILASPFLYQRYLYFGSPFSYGENSRYFVFDHWQVWAKDFPSPTFNQYLNERGWSGVFERFFSNGLILILATLFFLLIPALLWPFAIYGFFKGLWQRPFYPIIITLLVWLAFLIPLFEIYGTPRHLYPIMPLMLLLSAVGLTEIFQNHRQREVLLMLFLAVFIIYGIFYTTFYLKYDGLIFARETKQREFLKAAPAVAGKIRGTLAIGDGGDIVMMQLPDTTVAGAGLLDLSAPRSGLRIVYPGLFTTIEPLMEKLKKLNVTHFSVSHNFIDETPWRWRWLINSQVYLGKEFPPYLEKVYSNDWQGTSFWRWDIYKINWADF